MRLSGVGETLLSILISREEIESNFYRGKLEDTQFKILAKKPAAHLADFIAYMDHLRSVIDIEDSLRSSQRQTLQELDTMHAVCNNLLRLGEMENWDIKSASYLVTA